MHIKSVVIQLVFLYFLTGLFLCHPKPAIAAIENTDTLTMYLQNKIDQSLNLSNRNPDKALRIAVKALQIANYHKTVHQKADLLRIIGLIWFYKVDYSKALDYFTNSLELCRKINYIQGQAAALNNISVIYLEQKLYSKALKMDSTILKMRIQLNDSIKIAGSYNNLAVTHDKIGNYTKALQNYQKAVTISKVINNNESLPLYYNNLGNVYLTHHKLDSALHYFINSLEISRELNDKQMETNALTNIGKYYNLIDQPQNAIKNLEQSLKIAKEIGIVYEIESAAFELHLAYAAMHDYKNAYAIYQLAQQMKDSANNSETIQKITQFESELKFQKEMELEKIKQQNRNLENQVEINKQKQFRNYSYLATFAFFVILIITYLNFKRKSRDNEVLKEQKLQIISQKKEIETQRDKIEALNKTKDKFFAIIAHDLKNPLGGVYHLAEMIMANFNNLDRDKLNYYIEQIHHSSEKAFVLLDNLLQWATLQMGKLPAKKETVDVLYILNENIELFQSLTLQKEINISFSNCTDCSVKGDALMINTIVRNLLSNAIKFTPPKGTINISLIEETDFWTIAIKDSGIGIANEHLPKLFQLNSKTYHIGNSKEKGTGLGLVLCKEFTDLNSGKLAVKSELGKGTTFYVSFIKALPQKQNKPQKIL
jgi:signal transduction histidine kinase